MLKVGKSSSGSALTWTLSGVIDEHAGFEKEFSDGAKELIVICGEIERINSVGVLLWRRFFSKLRNTGVKIKFQEIAPVILIQTGFIADLILKDEADTMHLPFTCSSCSDVTGVLFTKQTLAQFAQQPTSQKCKKCGSEAVFDELIEEYTGLLG